MSPHPHIFFANCRPYQGVFRRPAVVVKILQVEPKNEERSKTKFGQQSLVVLNFLIVIIRTAADIRAVAAFSFTPTAFLLQCH